MLRACWIDSTASNLFLLLRRVTVQAIQAGSCTPNTSAGELDLNIAALACLMMVDDEFPLD